MYRGITLSPAVSKLSEHVLIELYEDQLGSDHLQFGFKKEHGCVHALFTFKETTNYFVSKGGKVFCAFLDDSKASDKVMRRGLLVKLLKKNISLSFVQILRNWYIKLNASVLWNDIYGRIFPIFCGVRQGGVLSPILFSIYVDDLIQHLRQSGCGVHVGSLFVRSIMYADDIALLSGSCRGLQKM